MKTLIAAVALTVLCSFSFDPILKTNLKITVLNELGNIEKNVAITIYRNEHDYRKEINPIGDVQYTNEKGRTTFKNLEPLTYYIYAKKGDKTNVGAGVVSDILKSGKINKLTIIIE